MVSARCSASPMPRGDGAVGVAGLGRQRQRQRAAAVERDDQLVLAALVALERERGVDAGGLDRRVPRAELAARGLRRQVARAERVVGTAQPLAQRGGDVAAADLGLGGPAAVESLDAERGLRRQRPQHDLGGGHVLAPVRRRGAAQVARIARCSPERSGTSTNGPSCGTSPATMATTASGSARRAASDSSTSISSSERRAVEALGEPRRRPPARAARRGRRRAPRRPRHCRRPARRARAAAVPTRAERERGDERHGAGHDGQILATPGARRWRRCRARWRSPAART